MRRTKEWWARLSTEERSRLVYLEKYTTQASGRCCYLPDDCGECHTCSTPTLGGGLCDVCSRELDKLIQKGEQTQ